MVSLTHGVCGKSSQNSMAKSNLKKLMGRENSLTGL